MNRITGAMVLVVATLMCVVGSVRDAGADIVLRERFPTEGQAISVIVQDAVGVPVVGATVSAVYRPGSSVESESVVGTSSTGGQLTWTPQIAGIATLQATWTDDDGTETTMATNVSIKFASAPISGVLIMVLAGLLLVGGSLWRIRGVLTSQAS